MRYSTHRRYQELLRIHALPVIGGLPLGKLTTLHLDDLYSRRLAAGVSAQTVLHVHRVLHSALASAESWDLVERNVAHRATAPKPRQAEIDVYSAEQVALTIRAGRSHVFGTLFVLAVTTGLRKGEILGLRWSDVRLDEAAGHVRGSMQRAAHGSIRGDTKSPKSNREVRLLTQTCSMLSSERWVQTERRHLAGAAWATGDLVFTNQWGIGINPDRVCREWRKFTTANGLPFIMFKNLRHTYATLHLDTGTPDKVVSEALGHSRTSTTNAFYQRVDRRHQADAAGRLEALLVAHDGGTVAGGVAGGGLDETLLGGSA